MTAMSIKLAAVDTLHFRDSRSFPPMQTSPEHLSGQYPPNPATVVGAIRAWLARGQGWSGGPWIENITSVLGSGHGPESLGQIRFDGPYVLRGGEPLFAMPAHILGVTERGAWRASVVLRPGEPVPCDLGEGVLLPEGGTPKAKPPEGWWLTRSGLAAVLAGGLPGPEEVVPQADLWSVEERVGIKRDDATRTVREHMLYASRHVRPAKDVAVGVRVSGVPDGWRDRCASLLPLGGEGRLASVEDWNGDATCMAPIDEILKQQRALIVALTPVDASADLVRPGARIPELGGATVVSACLRRVERIGGWASDGRRGVPVALRSVLSAGSTFFCEIDDPNGLREAYESTGGSLRIGKWQQWGFGAVALGLWPTGKEVSK